MLNQEQIERLEKLRYYPTKYEIALMHEDGRKLFAGFRERTTIGSLAKLMQEFGPDIVKNTGMPKNFTFKLRPNLMTLNDGWSFGKTGRTERQVIQEGKLPVQLGQNSDGQRTIED